MDLVGISVFRKSAVLLVSLFLLIGSARAETTAKDVSVTSIFSSGTLLLPDNSTAISWQATTSVTIRNVTSDPLSELPFSLGRNWRVSKIATGLEKEILLPSYFPRKVDIDHPVLVVTFPTPIEPGAELEVRFTYDMAVTQKGIRSYWRDPMNDEWPAAEMIMFDSASQLLPLPAGIDMAPSVDEGFADDFDLSIEMFIPAAMQTMRGVSQTKNEEGRRLTPVILNTGAPVFLANANKDYRWIELKFTRDVTEFSIAFHCNLYRCRGAEFATKILNAQKE